MPPIVRFSREAVLDAAYQLIRRDGPASLNARAVAKELGGSTQPIFRLFSGMEELKSAVTELALTTWKERMKERMRDSAFPYLTIGMSFLLFARDEPELFKLLFMCDRRGQTPASSPDFEASVEMIMKANGITRDKAELMHLEMWSCVHGIGTMLATSFLSLDWELISDMLSDIYLGLRTRYLLEDVK